ncbi:unnamed protein product, partial [Closterium sp. NIES-53]
LAGELPLSRGGKQYIVLMVEDVSNWLEVKAIPSKRSRHVAAAFKEQVISRFGACAEVLTDQGTEFQGEFKKLLEETGITHRRTSRYHPQSDGLTERLVQTLKRGLRACGEKRKRDWDEELHWIAAGYRFGKRAKYLWVMMPAALENLHTAQLRDAKRYEQRQQQGAGERARKGVSQGQEVYLRRAKQDTLDVGVGTERWRVREVRPSGILVLESEKGAVLKEHQTNTAVVKGSKPQQVGPVTRAQAARARAQEGAVGD